jgi:hypothetical protein
VVSAQETGLKMAVMSSRLMQKYSWNRAWRFALPVGVVHPIAAARDIHTWLMIKTLPGHQLPKRHALPVSQTQKG